MRQLFRMVFVILLSVFASVSKAQAQTPSEPTLLQLKSDIESLKAQLKVLQDKKLTCTDGKSALGSINKWSAWSVCPEGAVATGLARVDIQGSHDVPTNHVNDFQCGEKGCRAWCIGNPCEVLARCCR